MAESIEKPIGMTARPTRPQEFYDSVKQKYAEERDLRLNYRPNGTAQYTSDLTGDLSRYEVDPYAGEVKPREPINDTVEVLFIGGGFSALLTSARLRERGLESIRIVERGADVGGTWYWNRYPGVACDVVAYDYLPLLDEMDYVPKDHYAKGPEIFAHCQAIARKYNLYELAVFQTTVTSTVWDPGEQMWNLETDRGDRMNPVGAPDRLRSRFAQPEKTDLALLHQLGHGADGIFDRHRRIDAMLIVEIDHLDAEALEARLARTHDVFRTAVRDLAAAARAQIAELRRQYDFGAAPLDGLADDLFVVAEAVHVGRVEKGNAPIQRVVNKGYSGLVVARAVGARKGHAAQSARGCRDAG